MIHDLPPIMQEEAYALGLGGSFVFWIAHGRIYIRNYLSGPIYIFMWRRNKWIQVQAAPHFQLDYLRCIP